MVTLILFKNVYFFVFDYKNIKAKHQNVFKKMFYDKPIFYYFMKFCKNMVKEWIWRN